MFSLSTLVAHGQNNLYVHEKSGSTQSFALSGIKKLTFTDYNISIERKGTTTEYFSIENIAYMGFKAPVNIFERPTENFSIYPNPVTNNLTVANNGLIDDLKIFDIQGKIYLNFAPKAETINIDMSSFAAGVYFLRLVSNGKISTSKVIKKSNF